MSSIPTFLRKTIADPFMDFIHDSRSVGILLLLCTAISLLLTNSSAGVSYLKIIAAELPSSTESFIHLPHSILHWINDGLMAIFFFLAGMEIKREITAGELSTPSKALLPVFAAIGGMIVPALIYFAFTRNSLYAGGWGIPMATDIAFSLGIASLLGKRVPVGLKVFLTALAIIDDLGAILAIALFYSSTLHWIYLGAAALIVVVLYLLMRFKLFGWWNFILGILLWYCFYNSGIHATIAGVLFALFIPSERLPSIEHIMHVPVNFIIIPLFALFNTAIILPADIVASLGTTLSFAIIAGLFIGKPLGITLAAYISVRLKFGSLPAQVNWRHIFGAGLLAGIGFTMSIFIAMLAFDDAATIDLSKIAVLLGSLLSMIAGVIWLRFFCRSLTA